jgi:hypothetical protein
MKHPASTKSCNHCPLRLDWPKRRAIIRRELRRHHLSERERHLAEIILDLTLGWERETIVVPQLQCFTDLTGIGRPHVTEGIQDLHAMRIIRVIHVKGQPTYSIREDTDNWKVKPRVSIQAMVSSLNLVRDWNGLAPMTEPLETLANFKNCRRAKKTKSTVPESGAPREMPVNLTLPNLY